jgi:diadenosine tetraphosphatase ApaH/serine/threonine PP2A family protein phosphatase
VKTGILSDIHGNLEALEAVLADMARQEVERYWCLGDVVGYGANPNECVHRVREVSELTVIGNHDAVCVGAEDASHFNPRAREAVIWTQGQLTEESRDWLKGLPLTENVESALLVHASPFEPANWHYIHTRMRMSEMIEGFKATPAAVSFVGHSHQALILVKKGEEYFRFLGDKMRMEEGSRYLVNVGSVGQPRDGNPKAAYAIYDTDSGDVALLRVAYDIPAVQKKIREAGLPALLAKRLEEGI